MEISKRKNRFPNISLIVVIFMLFIFLTSGWIRHGIGVQGIFHGDGNACMDLSTDGFETLDDLIRVKDENCEHSLAKSATPLYIIQNQAGIYSSTQVQAVSIILLSLALITIISLTSSFIDGYEVYIKNVRFILGMTIIIACIMSLANLKLGSDGALVAQLLSTNEFKLAIFNAGEYEALIIGGGSFFVVILGAMYIVSRERPRVALYSALVLSSIIALLPFFWMISTSFMSLAETRSRQWLPSEIKIGSAPLFDTDSEGNVLDSDNIVMPFDADIVMNIPARYEVPLPANYISAWNDANYGKFFMNSVVITSISIVGLLTMSILSGYAFARIDFIGRNVIFTMLLATLMIPASVTMIPNFLTIRGSTFALPNFAVQFDGLMPTGVEGSWQAGTSWLNTLYALTVPFMGSAFSIFLLRQFFSQIPNELWDAARIDGSGHPRFLVQICLPISKPAILTVTLLTFIQSWNAFLWPLIVTTEDKWRPIMVGLFNFVADEGGSDTHLIMAGVVITIAPMAILYFFTQKSFTEGIATSGLKG
jgi:ABC-type glycerol-3-phosphate transport system permease component